MDKYIPGIGVCAGSWMLKWDMMTQAISQNDLQFNYNDDVNVFINFESVLKNLYLQKNLQTLITYHKKDVVIELESAIINLMANYKAYFNMKKCNPKLYFYYTDLNSSEQQMYVYNKHYRNFYKNHYLSNPQFKMMGELITNIIIPEVSLILSYIPNCYFITSHNFDGSIIPEIISRLSQSKNVIITGDVFDTLYMFNPNFMTFYIKRRFSQFSLHTNVESVVRSIVKEGNAFDLNIFNSELYFRMLLSIKGSKIRNIKSAKGFGYGKFMNIMQEGIKEGIILSGFSNIDSVINLFPERYAEDIKKAFQCVSIDTQYKLIGEGDIENIKSQIVDRVDIESVEMLNNKRFLDFPINLQSLIN